MVEDIDGNCGTGYVFENILELSQSQNNKTILFENEYLSLLAPSDWKVTKESIDGIPCLRVETKDYYVQIRTKLNILSNTSFYTDLIIEIMSSFENKIIVKSNLQSKFEPPGEMISRNGVKYIVYKMTTGDNPHKYKILFTFKEKTVYMIDTYILNSMEGVITNIIDSIVLK